MEDTSKYLIHARIAADGVVERSDVVGAVFGQTEGLLGDDLDLRDLQQSSKVGRIDVEIDSEGGQSFGRLTIASSLDRVETAIVAASLETITRIGPCAARVEVTRIEDVREAKRREVVQRAKELLAESFDDTVTSSADIVEEVREAIRVADVTEYEGLPAGPRVADGDAVVVVEGRADVLTLLRYGVKNAVAVEGTNVPDAVADLTREPGRTVTVFVDGDRGGELVLRELAQVGAVDYVAFAPEGRSVEELSRGEVRSALRRKVPFERLPEEGSLREGFRALVGDGATGATSQSSAAPAPGSGSGSGSTPPAGSRSASGTSAATDADVGGDAEPGAADATDAGVGADPGRGAADADASGDGTGSDVDADADGDAVADGDADGGTGAAVAVDADGDADVRPGADADGDADVRPGADADGDADVRPGADADVPDGTGADADPASLGGHARVVDGTGDLRLLDREMRVVGEGDAADAFDLLVAADDAPYAAVLDGELTQRVLDVAAQRGVEQIVAASTGEFVKQPIDVRVRTADQLVAVEPRTEA